MDNQKLKTVTKKQFREALIKDGSEEALIIENAMANSEFINGNEDSDNSELSRIEILGEFIPYILMGGDQDGADGCMTYGESYKAIEKLIHTYNQMTGYYELRSNIVISDI